MKITTLRFPELLQKSLRDEAKAKNVSLNKLVIAKLKAYPEVQTIMDRLDFLEVSLEEMQPIIEWGRKHIKEAKK